MKTEILNFFKTDRSFENGKKLYFKYGLKVGFKNSLNKQSESEYLKGILFEELRALAQIPVQEFSGILKLPIVKSLPEQLKDKITDADKITPEIKEKFIREIPEQVKKTIRLREEFPFLASPDCPNELKILVHDMITAYTTYVDDHKKLFEATTGEELQEIAASVVENYIENHQIWDELNYFKANGEILGKHPIFSQTDRMAEIQAMSTADHVKLQKNLMNNIARTKKNIADAPEHKNTEERKKSVEQWEFELDVVNKILGLDARTV